MLFDKIPNQNQRSQKSFTRIRQIRQLPLCFPKNCVRIRQNCISMRQVPRVQRAFGEKALHFHSAKRRVKMRNDRLLKPTQSFPPHSQTPTAPLERRLCIFTQLNGASRRGSTVCSNQHSHSHLTTKLQTRVWKDGSIFSLS